MEYEDRLMNMAIEYRQQYEICAWWKFRKRKRLRKRLDFIYILMEDRYVNSKIHNLYSKIHN